ncbi:MAG: hypothetical protein WD533_01120 [Dehalococcoidia bacterium]
MLVRFLRVLALSMGIAGWAVIALIFFWVERNDGEVLLHNNRMWPTYEPIADMLAIALAFAVITSVLVYEIATHLRGR